MRAERLGLLGGTFDPPHVGHAIVAQDVVEALELDRLLVVPAGDPPHRSAVFAAALRLAWTRRVFEGDGRIEVLDDELRRAGPSYTVDTLALIRRERQPSELYCVMGADQLRTIDTWHEYRRLPELARIAVMRRVGEAAEPPVPADRIAYITIDVMRIDLSSTRVRERLRAGRSIRYLVPERIRAQVEQAWNERAPEGARASRGC
ncbi:MAG: nicotinate (nicotinamide) nucleotide adenylyltransferase [Gemmatimonadota bacterium]